jgi:hypothetical protein
MDLRQQTIYVSENKKKKGSKGRKVSKGGKIKKRS